MYAFAPDLGAFTLEHLFAGSLLGGLVISAILFLSISRLPLRIRRLRGRAARRDENQFLPATVGITISCFGLVGLILRVLVDVGPTMALAASIALSLLAFSWMVAATRRMLDRSAQPMEGSALVGSVAHVCLAIPEGGVGAIAYVSEGKRHTMPARSDRAVDLGARVLVTDVHRRFAIVDELDLALLAEA